MAARNLQQIRRELRRTAKKSVQCLNFKVKAADGALRAFFSYRDYDSDEYWRKRVDSDSLFWNNPHYNSYFRKLEFETMARMIEKHTIPKVNALDVGCGKGDVSMFLIRLGFKQVDATDFPQMVRLAERANPHPHIRYISSSAQDYLVRKEYHLIVSSSCFSMIRNIHKMFEALDNCISMLANGGYLLMIDPFHNSNLLARARISADQVVDFMHKRCLTSLEKSGILFWPFRVFTANDTSLSEYQTRILCATGESMLAKLGRYAWGDYKVLLFKKALG